MAAVDHATNHRVSRTHTQAFHTRLLAQRSRAKFLIGHSCGTLLWHPLVRHPPRETSCKTLTSSTQNERFARDFLRNSDIKSPKRAFRTRLTPRVTRQVSKSSISCETVAKTHPLPQLTTSRFPALATNLSASTPLTRTKYCACHEMSPPSHIATSRFPAPATKITLPRVSKTSVSYETYSKSHASSLQIGHFVRDFLQNSYVKVCPTRISYETSSKRHPLKRQSQCDSDIHLHRNSQPHDSLRLPRILLRPHV